MFQSSSNICINAMFLFSHNIVLFKCCISLLDIIVECQYMPLNSIAIFLSGIKISNSYGDMISREFKTIFPLYIVFI